MKVAIIGAGIAGLSCAHELERYGISPVIYEKNGFIGEEYPHVGTTLEVVNRPIKDALQYFKNTFGIEIRPLNNVNSIIHHAPDKTTVIRGNLGYFIERSKDPMDIKVQIHSQLRKTRVNLNHVADYSTLAKKYDYVVIANGNNIFAKELGCWQEWVHTYVKGAVVLGDFDPTSITVWVNKAYCKNGYAYLTPYNNKKASLILVVTEVDEFEIEEFWKAFIYYENLRYDTIETFKLNHISGLAYPHQVEGILLAGNAGGAIDPFLGFGIISSVTSGVMAARSIATGKSYEKLLTNMTKINLHLYEFRKAFNSANRDGLNKIMTFIGMPGIRQLIYKTPINIIKAGGTLLRLKREIKGE